MNYNIVPFGNIWKNGIFNVPCEIVDKFIKFASEYQLKALLIILRHNGVCTSEFIAKKLGLTVKDTEEMMEFWISENIVTNNIESTNYIVNNNTEVVEEKSEIETAKDIVEQTEVKTAVKVEKKKETKKSTRVTPPTLTPKDIVRAASENPEIAELLNEAQVMLGRTISLAEQEMIVNLVNFYALKTEVILMIFEFCNCQKEKDPNLRIGTAYIMKIADNWMDEGINSIELAEAKIMEIEKSDKRWKEICNLADIGHKSPTQRQKDMISRWYNDFSIEMISIAIERMKENASNPSLNYVDSILKSWKKKGIKTVQDVYNENKQFEKRKAEKANKNDIKINRAPTYDIEKIKRDALNNTKIKF